MKTMAGIAAGAVVSLALVAAAVAEQKSGVVAAGPPEDVALTIAMAADGSATLSQSEFHLAQGGYYRFNLVCPPAGLENEVAISFAAPELWENSHLRIASVADTSKGLSGGGEINFHMQGLQVRLVECEGLPQTARFSFYPIKKGTYPFTMVNSAIKPEQELKGSFIVE
jgi:hypothetical protein